MTQKQDSIKILAIESSCDDTAVAIINNGKILANIVSGQIEHSKYGGVIPELAGRAHLRNIGRVTEEAIIKSGIHVSELDAIAYTQGPGLMGSLLVGAQFAKGLAMGLKIPIIGVDHLKAHVAAHYIDEPIPEFPFVNLLVSGGHTQIALLENELKQDVLASTDDDAAGEAFDKAAKMLGLDYPGGPLLDKLAESGDPHKFKFPISQVGDTRFSFSGLKTSILYFIKENQARNPDFIESNLHDICASIRYTIVKTLLDKLEIHLVDKKVEHAGISGGVSANLLLRREFQKLCDKLGVQAHIPAFEYCTDNAGMIAITAHYKYLNSEFGTLQDQVFTRH